MTCPACNNPKAYVGFLEVECPVPTCRNFDDKHPHYQEILAAINEICRQMSESFIVAPIVPYTYNLPKVP